MSGLLATLPPDAADHLAVMWFIWRTFAAVVAVALLATLVALGAARLRRARGGLGRGRVERVAP